MAAAAYFDQIQQLYIAYFGRPADAVGLAYWANQVDAANGSVAAVIAGFASSVESNALYSGVSTTQKVNAIYLNLFNRVPEASGLVYWAALIDSGAVSQAQAAYQIQSSAGPGDATAVANKLAVAKAFTAQIDTAAEIAGYSGATAAASARAFLAQIDATTYNLNLGTNGAAAALAAASGTTATTPVVITPTPAPLFSVTENAGTHVLEFGGVATGTITMSMPDLSHAIFSRGGNVTPSVALATVTKIDLPTNAITLTPQLANDLRTTQVRFDASDAVTVTGILNLAKASAVANFTTTNLGGSSVTLVAGDGAWSVTGATLTTALQAGVKLSGALTVTDIVTGNEAAALTNFTAASTGSTSVLLNAADTTWSVTASALTTLLAGNTKLGGIVSVGGIASVNETTALTNFTAANIGSTSVLLNATDGNWSVTASALSTLLAGNTKLGGIVIVNGISSLGEATALTDFTASKVGATVVSLGATDGTWTVTSTALGAASTANVVLETLNVVTIVNTLTQGNQTIKAGTFQSGNDKLQFSANELRTASGFGPASGVPGTIDLGMGDSANLVVGTGGTLVGTPGEAAFLFDTSTGQLSFDVDGDGQVNPVNLLILSGVTSLSINDFSMV